MKEIPEVITLAKLEVIVMPNGEILSDGKSLGWFRDFKKYLTKVDEEK